MTELIDSEWALLSNVLEQDVIEVAIDLDLVAPEVVDRRALLGQCVEPMITRFQEEGLPLSKYDRMDLEELTPAQLAAIAKLFGVSATVDAVLKAGQKVYKLYQRQRPNNAVALMVPSLLPVIARVLSER